MVLFSSHSLHLYVCSSPLKYYLYIKGCRKIDIFNGFFSSVYGWRLKIPQIKIMF